MPLPRVTPEMVAVRRTMFPELERAGRRFRRALAARPAVRRLLAQVEAMAAGGRAAPGLPYSLYRQFQRTGDRGRFEGPYFERRRMLTAAALVHFLRPGAGTLDALQDLLWALCEESTWILPAHERGGLDLFATETAFALAETLELFRGELAGEVDARVRAEVRRRVTDPFLAGAARRVQPRTADGAEDLAALALGTAPLGIPFMDGHNNWTGVCASSTGAALLYCEGDPRRLSRGLNLVLGALGRFLAGAFAADGASDEGVAYWHYGLMNFVAFAELLRGRTGGRCDLLAGPRMRLIARSPLAVRLSEGWFYSHADCPPRAGFHPGVMARLAERAGEPGLLGLLNGPLAAGYRLPMLLRDLLWWDGRRRAAPPVGDALLPAVGIFRLRSGPLVLAGKAGHNAENHNHNDVGSFVLHCRGEDLLCDPGAPPYTREFFGPRRYELFVQAASRGHSVPLVGGAEQQRGREFRGALTAFRPDGPRKSAEVEFAEAYPVRGLARLGRRLELAPGGSFRLEDRFAFSGRPLPVEEALVTWLPVAVRGRTAVVRGRRSTLTLRIAEPAGARFRLEQFDLRTHSREPVRLRRIVVDLPAASTGAFRVEGRVLRRLP
ncbi:MAG TPA: heparinase II/III family protein [Planctomycetota bacterium]|nr:heparinase II/III family protein [Planctomycetota bacterium]